MCITYALLLAIYFNSYLTIKKYTNTQLYEKELLSKHLFPAGTLCFIGFKKNDNTIQV